MSDAYHSKEVRAEMFLFVTVIIWAANYPLMKWGISGFDIFIFNAIRFVVASMVVLLLFIKRPGWKPVAPSDWLKLIATGIVANILYQLVFVWGLTMTTAGNSAVLISTSPLWTVFFSAKLHKERIRRQMWVGMGVSLLGVIIIAISRSKNFEFGGSALKGDLISLTAAIVWGLSTNLQKPLLARYSVLQTTLILMLVGGIGLTLVAIPSTASLSLESVHWTHIFAAVASGALSIGLGNVLWSNGVKLLGPGRTANFSNLTPVLAFIISYLVLHETISVGQIIGVSVTIAGVWIVRR